MAHPATTPKPPDVYDFDNWRHFYYTALSYHLSTRPNDVLISQRIETFKKYMSSSVTSYLGNLVQPRHQRYNTVEGWDDWVIIVMALLSAQDSTAKKPVSVKGWVSKYRKGRIDKYDLWLALDDLAGRRWISAEDQRSGFWNALSPSTKQELLEENPCFDPKCETWSSHDKDAIGLAEQKLFQLMCFGREKRPSKRLEKARLFFGVIVAVLVWSLCLPFFRSGIPLFAVCFLLLIASGVLIGLLIRTLMTWKHLKRIADAESA